MKQIVVIADDHEGNRKTLKDILEYHLNAKRPGVYEVEHRSVSNAIESLRSLGRKDIALVIADPGDPTQTERHTFFQKGLPRQTKFIGLTCYSDEIPCYHPEKNPTSKYYAKPVKIPELLHAVEVELKIAA